MTKKVYEKVMIVGRATTFMVGLAAILALTVGLASSALAGTGVGARFDLGKINTVNAITKLVGSVAGPSLQIDNNSTNASATALDLQVESGKAPMKVNSATQVANLNSDLLDGKDSGAFWSGDTYMVKNTITAQGGGHVYYGFVYCDPGDKVLGGGGGAFAFEDDMTESGPVFDYGPGTGEGWRTFVRDNGASDNVEVEAVCADFPPIRP